VRTAEKKYGKADRRPVAIHAQTARLDQVEAFKAGHHSLVLSDAYLLLGRLASGLGAGTRASRQHFPHRLGSRTRHDLHVAPRCAGGKPDPMRVLSARHPRDAQRQVLGPEHRTTPLVALKAHHLVGVPALREKSKAHWR